MKTLNELMCTLNAKVEKCAFFINSPAEYLKALEVTFKDNSIIAKTIFECFYKTYCLEIDELNTLISYTLNKQAREIVHHYDEGFEKLDDRQQILFLLYVALETNSGKKHATPYT